MRWIAPLLVVLLLAGTGWWLLRSGERAERHALQEIAGDTAESASTPIATGDAPAPLREEQSPPPRTEPSEPETPAEPEAEPEPIEVSGSIVVTDEDGIEHVAEDGSLRPTLYRGHTGTTSGRVLIEGGRFHFTIPGDVRLRIDEARLRDRFVVLDERGEVEHPEEPLLLRGHWTPDCRLEVLDAVSLTHLDDVSVIRVDTWRERGSTHPGSWTSYDELVAHAASPLTIPHPGRDATGDGDLRVAVGARDHAWTTVNLHFAEGGEYRVLLERGADLTVVLHGELPGAAPDRDRASGDLDLNRPLIDVHAALVPGRLPTFEQYLARFARMPASEFEDGIRPNAETLRPQYDRLAALTEETVAGRILIDQADTSRPITWHGLPEGPVEVSVVVGSQESSRAVLGRARAELVAGRETRVTIEIEPLETVARVPLAGTLVVPAAWELTDLTLHFEPTGIDGLTRRDRPSLGLGEMRPVPGRPDTFAWDLGPVLAGRYSVRSMEPQLWGSFETGPEGRTDVALVLPPPADVIVSLLDDRTGLPIPGDWIPLRGVWPEVEGLLTGAGPADWDPDGQVYRERIAVSMIEIMPYDRAYGWQPFDPVTLHPGENRITLRLHHRTGILLTIREGGEPLELPRGWLDGIRFTPVQGTGTASHDWSDDGRHQFALDAPGTWDVELPELEGFAPIPLLRVEVPDGVVVECEVELRRSP